MSLSVFINSIKEDLEILLTRALLQKQVFAFGDDGLGKYGRSDIAKSFEVVNVDVEFDVISDDTYEARVHLYLNQYSSSNVGHIFTDQNFLISIRKHLIAAGIDPQAVEYDGLENQGLTAVCLKLDADLILEWA